MAIIYSTDKRFKRSYKSRKRATNNAHFTRDGKDGKLAHGAGNVTFSIDITRRCFGTKKCVLGYDDERKEILVVPTMDGNINIIKSGSPNTYEDTPYRKISMKQFLRFIGLKDEEFPHGNYPCEVDEKNVVHIFLDKVKHEVE